MPIYEYACRKCGKTAEYMQRMSDPPKRKCEHCGSQSLERVISQTSFQLKGSGWYKDLYSSPKPAASSEGKGESGSSGSDSGAGSSSSEAASTPSTDAGSSGSSGPEKPASKTVAPKASSKGATRVASSGRGAGSSKAGGGKAKKGSR